MEELVNKYKNYKKDLERINYVLFILSFDEATDCPKNDKLKSLEVQQYYFKERIGIITSEEYKSLVKKLYENVDKLDEVTQLDVKLEYKSLTKLDKIPHDELIKHMENMNRSGYEWEKARDTLDYKPFVKELEELVEFYKKSIVWQQTDSIKGYDVLLDEMEEGYSTKLYDEFFDVIEAELVPFVNEVLAKTPKYNKKLDNLKFSISKQKELTDMIAKAMEYDENVGCIRETAHPFTNWANHNDVRITTSYDESLLFSNLYSVMHEIGHALFQLQMDSKYDGTNIFNNVTCITHESQSRFYENYLGRSRGFVRFLYPKLVELFPEELADITEDDIYYYVNAVTAQLYRTEADELTYPLHVLIRYKVEKMLFNNEITVQEMEETFNGLMKKYLGITPLNMKEGVFQDVHWSSGFGYFPTYAVGSAYGAQYLEALKKEIDVDKELSAGNFKNINKWLKENIHTYSGTRKNLEVVRSVCGEEFDVNKYISYLKNKFKEIYF